MAGLAAGYVDYPEVALSPWLQELVDRYQEAQRIRWPTRRTWIIAAVLALIVGTPLLLRLDSTAYPIEPERQHALDSCSRSDPTFVRFLPGDRDACYRRILMSKALE